MPRYVDNVTNRKLKRVGKLYSQRPQRSQRGGGDDAAIRVNMPDPIFPTKEQLLEKLDVWNSINCIKYKKGSVMIVDNAKDSKHVSSCELFKLHVRIQKDILYQYILYQLDGKNKILLTPVYVSPEIGTKHNCLLSRLEPGVNIIMSGELIRRDNTVYYSCVSSLFFIQMMPLLFPSVHGKEKHVVKELYERHIITYMNMVVPKKCQVMYVKSMDFDLMGPDTRLKLDPTDFCRLSPDKRPTCLRYMTDSGCETAQHHPTGYCNGGIDFCDNYQHDDPKLESEISEEDIVYGLSLDKGKALEYLKSHGINPPKGRETLMAKALGKKQGLSPEEIKQYTHSRQQIWPPTSLA